ncbi:MAG: hypothetical protein KKB20_12880 [Proteobacteria bacterium]|nr:hypothetical protein [Pseudomonadota bacterium]
MKTVHAALVSASEQHADRFFQELLGLTRLKTKAVSAELAGRLFGRPEALNLIDYGGPDFRFEIFLDPDHAPTARRLDHVCLEIADREAFLDRAQAMGLEVRRAHKDGKQIVFIADFDGNLYEITETA